MTSSRHLDLLVILVVHEVEAVAVRIEEVVLLVLDEGALDLLGGLEAVGHLDAVGEAAHVDLRRRRALAGKEALGGQDDAEMAVLALDDVALANRAGDDFHFNYPFAARARTLRREFARHKSDRSEIVDTLPLLGARTPRRPAAAAPGPRPRAAALRAWFAAEGFIEVEPAALQLSPGNETHLHGFSTELITGDGDARAGLSPHLAGIRDEKAARGGRDAHLRAGARVPQPRAHARCTRPNSRCSNGTASARGRRR